MPRYIALLRGINVGGNRSVRMEALRKTVTAAGGTDVETYIQSGNVVLGHALRSPAKVAEALTAAISKACKFDVPVVVRTAAEWDRVIADNPFAGAAPEHLHVFFLPAAPPADALDRIDAAAFAPERFVPAGRELYLALPNGIGRSQLVGKGMRVKALAPATARNWRTVLRLQAMARGTG